jgi:hypothetical protein
MIVRALVSFALAAAAFAIGSCYFAETPGTGSRAQTGYRAAAPVIAALEAFHREHGHYPRSLQDLAPKYLDAAATNLDTYYIHGFRYHSAGGSYTVGFRYDAAAINECEYDSRTKKWDCSGYF